MPSASPSNHSPAQLPPHDMKPAKQMQRPGRRRLVLGTLLVCGLCAGSVADVTADEVSFETSVAPVVAARCVSCHNDREANGGLSLVTRAAALRGGDSGAAMVPGKPDDSLLIDYISGSEPLMPQEDEPLAAAEVEAIRRWIAAGALWPDSLTLKAQDNWWSRQPLVRPPLPAVAAGRRERVRTPIDRFIIARLHERGMHLSPEADKRTLARRLYFDLIGLPPAPAEIDRFVESDDPQAYEQLVDRLLASPAYGERWARHWLDVVKYADTCGYDKDKLRPRAWPYRDYVIGALNEDKPYARFVQEQVAGDALFPGDPDGILGLGFIAAGPWDFIGHVEVPESKIDGKIARHLDRDEMVTNTLNTFCSVTIQCARCHDHKSDPFTQEHYYGLQAVFAAVDRAERPYNLNEETELRRRELVALIKRVKQQLAEFEKATEHAGGAELVAQVKRVDQLRAQSQPQGKRPEYGYHSGIELEQDRQKWVQVDLGRTVELRRVILHPCHDEFAGIGAGFGFPARFKIEAADNAALDDAVVVADQTARDFPNPGLEPYEIEKPVRARYLRVTATQLAERRRDFIFALAELEALDADDQNVAYRAQVTAADSIEVPVRWRGTNLVDGIWPQAADPRAAAELATAEEKLAAIRRRINTPERRVQRAALQRKQKQAETELSQLPPAKMVYAAATNFQPQGNFKPTAGKPRPIHVLHRGNVLDPGAAAQPGTIPLPGDKDFVFSLPSDHQEADRRAALARWLTDSKNPLTWRSIVNRVWLYHIGQAIVGSPNDLGRMGQRPTHPELLDWLAVEFRDSGGSLKRLHKMIVTSSVYRQSSDHHEAFAEIDGGNQLLWRMNRRRLEAEEIRDAVLAAAGRLDRSMGGPGFYLFELEKTAHSPHYEYHKFDPRDPASHRRSIYRFIVRSQPDPLLTTLDCADSSQSTPKRTETVTSLQALSMLNNRFHLVMAEHFAARLQREHDTLDDQVRRAMRLVVARQPTVREQNQLEQYAREHGLANLCRLLFSFSEFVYLD